MTDFDVKLCFNEENKHKFDIILSNKTGNDSPAWKYFGTLTFNGKVISEGKNFCKPCLDKVQRPINTTQKNSKSKGSKTKSSEFFIKSYNVKTSTGNLIRHLEDEHSILIQSTKSKQSTLTVTDFFKFKPKKSELSTSKKNKKKLEEKFLLGRQLALWFCRDLLPFSLANGDGFITFMNSRGVNFTQDAIPHPTTIMRNALTDVYKTLKTEILSNMKSDYGALTFDTWTDNYRRRSYITFTFHEIVDFELRKYTLCTKVIPGSHTGEAISKEVASVLQAFNINDASKIYAVTDAGPNVVKGGRLLNMISHKCLGHGLHNLIMVDGIKPIPDLDNLIRLMRKTVTAVRYRASNLEEMQTADQNRKSNVANFNVSIFEEEEFEEIVTYDLLDDDLFEEETANDVNVNKNVANSTATTTVKTDSTTRWHSLLIMLESLQKNRFAVENLLRDIDSDILIQNKHWNLVDELINLLSRFRTCVELLSQEKNCTINLALLLYSDLKSIISETSKTDSPIIEQMKKEMLNNLDKRFPLTDLVILGSLLDPRFKHLEMIDTYLDTSCNTKETFLKEALKNYVQPRAENNAATSTEKSNTEETTSASKNKNSAYLSKLIEKYSSKTDANDFDKQIEAECAAYLKLPVGEASENVLKFWKNNQTTFPFLSQLAARILCVPATSTPSERVFSVAGTLISKKRSGLHPNNVNKIIFIHDNFELAKRIIEKREFEPNDDPESENDVEDDEIDTL